MSPSATQRALAVPGFDRGRIGDPQFFAENRLPAHSDHRWFADEAEVADGASSVEQCLNGTWKFH